MIILVIYDNIWYFIITYIKYCVYNDISIELYEKERSDNTLTKSNCLIDKCPYNFKSIGKSCNFTALIMSIVLNFKAEVIFI